MILDISCPHDRWSVFCQLSFSVPAEDKRPEIHAFFSDARFMLDVCVAHPSAPSRVRLAPGSALKYRENGKISAYEALAKEAGSRFVAFAFELFGGLGSGAL